MSLKAFKIEYDKNGLQKREVARPRLILILIMLLTVN